MPTPHPQLTDEQIEALGRELDALRARVVADLGERDVNYIRNMIRAQRGLELAGRGLLFLGAIPPAWLAGVTALSLSKILDNMEIGHNVMHGQYDWTRDPALDSHEFEWDTACPADQWRHSHNYMHHTHTNVLGKDRDIGYGILRMSEDQPWRPRDLGNPVYATLLALLFQWGVAVHDLEVERIQAGEVTFADKRDILKAIWEKGRRQVLKDYVAFPLLAGPAAPFVFTGNLTANLVRNVWSFMIIFCGHFPEGTEEFSEAEVENETRGALVPAPDARLGQPHRRARCSTSSAATCRTRSSTTCSPTSRPIDTPRSPSRSVRSATRYGLPYNTGPLGKQFGSVVKKIGRLALPGRGNGGDEQAAAAPAPTRPAAAPAFARARPRGRLRRGA